MLRLPRSIRFFRKPDHISFLSGFTLMLASIPTGLFELRLASVIFFTFTIGYEIYEISQGNRQVLKPDHFAFMAAYILLIVTFWHDLQILLVVSSVLFAFTLGYEIYEVRRKDLEARRRE